MTEIVILGTGIAGLTAASYLQKNLVNKPQITVASRQAFANGHG